MTPIVTTTQEALDLAARRLARNWLLTRANVQLELEGLDPDQDWDREPRPAELLAWVRLHAHATGEALAPADAPFPDPRLLCEWSERLNRSAPIEAEVVREIHEISKCLEGEYILAEREVYLDNRFSGGLDMSGRPSTEHGYITRQMRWLDQALQAHARKETEVR